MGYDKTGSRDKTIFAVGVVTCITLVISLPALRGYFFSVLQPLEAERAHGSNRSQLDEYHADQARALGGIDNAIASLGQRGRVASPAIAPRQSEAANVDAVEGWAEMKNEAAAADARQAFARAQAIREANAAALAGDAGVPVVPPTAPVPAAPAPTPVP